jgi:hypothetical protein
MKCWRFLMVHTQSVISQSLEQQITITIYICCNLMSVVRVVGPSCLVNIDYEIRDSKIHPTVYREDYGTRRILICI